MTTDAPAPGPPLYTPEQLHRLAMAHRLAEGPQLARVAEWLELAGRQYLVQRAGEHDGAEHKALRDELAAFASLADALAGALRALSPAAREGIDRAGARAAQLATMLPLPVAPDGVRGVAFGRGGALLPGVLPDTVQPIGWDTAWGAAAASGLADNARSAAAAHQLTGGRPFASGALRTWVANMQAMWTGELGRPFTYDAHRREGITPAFLFCRDALAILDPEAPAKTLGSVMRQLIRIARERDAARNNPPST